MTKTEERRLSKQLKKMYKNTSEEELEQLCIAAQWT